MRLICIAKEMFFCLNSNCTAIPSYRVAAQEYVDECVTATHACVYVCVFRC
jgi:hypothetical protein